MAKGISNIEWTEERVEALRDLNEKKVPITEQAKLFGVPRRNIDAKRQELGLTFTGSPEKVDRIRDAAMNPAVQDDRDGRILDLEKQLARLQQQLVWGQRCASTARTGGTLTFRASDHHYGDANHLISSCAQAHAKLPIIIQQYEPDRIQLVMGDDLVAGRGIYKNQDLDAAVSDPEQQCWVGAMKFRDLLLSVREVSAAPIRVVWMRGNHEYANGHPLASLLFLLVQKVCEDIADVSYILGWDAILVNLAHEGVHNALVMHGYGHSNASPNSPRFISDTKDRLLTMCRKLQPEEQPRRVLSGHTHWLSADLERIVGLKFDTTGGWQRNARVQLGMNQRPSGCIVYVGPVDAPGDILQPIVLQADDDTYLREVANASLPAMNQRDAADCIERYEQMGQDRGWFAPKDTAGVLAAGRW